MRSTYADVSSHTYRAKSACTLLGISENTLRVYSENSGIQVSRAKETPSGIPSPRIFTPDVIFALAAYRRDQGYVKTPAHSGVPLVITTSVMKGGTAKTTSSVELATHLQLLGMRCLVVDLDVQANASQMMGYEADLTDDEADEYGVSQDAIVKETLATVLIPYLERKPGADRIPPLDDVIKKPFGEHGPHLLPSDIYVSDIEKNLLFYTGKLNRNLILKKFLSDSCAGKIPGFNLSGYDVIIFDCPPSVSCTSTCALAAADIVLAPIRMDAFSLKGLTKLFAELQDLQESVFVAPELIILPTNYSANISRVGRMQAKLNPFKEFISPISISASEEFPKSLEGYMPLTIQKPLQGGAKEYKEFALYMQGKIMAMAEKRAAAEAGAEA